jgi:hypothetical protein
VVVAEAGFFLQFAVHRFQRRFVAAHAALRELPAVAVDAPAPEQFAAVAGDDDAHIGPVAIGIDHDVRCPKICPIVPYGLRQRQPRPP